MPATRERTLAHLQHLMTASALASCTRDADPSPVKHDPPPPPSATASASATPSASASVAVDPPPTADPPPSATITVAKPNPTHHGYVVVDMLPAPARCLAVAKSASVTGGFEPDPGGVKIRFVVTLKTPSVSFASTAPQAIGSTLLSSHFPNSSTAEIELRPTAGRVAEAQLALSCGAYGSAMLVVHATFAGPPAVGRPVSLTMTDY